MELIKEAIHLIEENKLDEARNLLPKAPDRSVYLLIKSLIEDKLGNFENRLDLCEEILSREDNDPIIDGLAISGILWVHFRKGNYDLATQYLSRYEKLFYSNQKYLTKEFPTMESGIWNSKGSIAIETGKLEEAVTYFRKAVDILEDIGAERRKASLLNNLAFALQKQGKFDDALSLYNKSLQYYESVGLEAALCRVKSNIAEIYRFKTAFSIALEYHKDVLEIREKLDNKYDLALSNYYVGQVYYDILNYESALLYLTQSRQQWESIGNSQWLSLTLLIIGKCLIAMGFDTSPTEAKFERLLENSDNPIIKKRYQLFRALLLKQSGRMSKVAEAQIILEKLVNSPIIDFELTYDAILSHAELLLLELSITQEPDIYPKIKVSIETLEQLAREHNSYGKIIEILLLRAKFAIIELEYEKAEKIIVQAEFIASEKFLTYYEKLVAKMRKLLHKDMMKLKSIIDDNKNLLERAEIVELRNYLKQAHDIKHELDR